MAMKVVFITGGTGYMGGRLISLLIKKGYTVKALVRKGSESKLPGGCAYVTGNPFDASSFSNEIPAGATFVQLLGVAHPGPKKKEQFKTIDLASAKASAIAAKEAEVQHFVYVSVAQTPAIIMHDYQQCRAEGEAATIATQIPATFIRPWYVVGPGHYWPVLFLPLFKILEWIPSTAHKAKALRLVTLKQMLHALLYSIQNPPVAGTSIIEIDAIRRM
jgi:uncharacterized protein YbjT (DUF2867 family)